jgi:hypothetical protein
MALDTKHLRKPKKGAPPPAAATANNLEKPPGGQKTPLQLNIDPELKREFKVYAAEHDLDMSILFATVWQYYRETHG